jgi:hypothetical protein
MLGPIVNQCVINQSQGYWLLFDALVTISLVIKMQVQCLVPNSLKTQDFDVELQVLQQYMQKKVVTVIIFVIL